MDLLYGGEIVGQKLKRIRVYREDYYYPFFIGLFKTGMIL